MAYFLKSPTKGAGWEKLIPGGRNGPDHYLGSPRMRLLIKYRDTKNKYVYVYKKEASNLFRYIPYPDGVLWPGCIVSGGSP